MVVSIGTQGDMHKCTSKKTSDEEQHVLCLGVLPFQVQGDGTSGTSSWKPVKDLVRSCMLRTAGDEPHVEMCDSYQNQFLPWAYVRMKREENARRVFDQIAGNTWYGAVLVVVWFFFSPSQQSLRLLRVGSELDRPKALETRSQIRDKRLLRRNPPANSNQNTESLSSNAIRIAMTIASNRISPNINPYGNSIVTQMNIPDPIYQGPAPQPWLPAAMGNQGHTYHNGPLFDQAHGQWIVPTSDIISNLNSIPPMTGPNMTTSVYPMPPMVMSPIALVSSEGGDFVSPTRYLDTNLNTSNSQTQPDRGTHETSKKSATHDSGVKTTSNDTNVSKVITYSPPVIVDGSKSTSSM